jgi:hypothetical protein
VTQSLTTRSISRYLPGHVFTPQGAGLERESLEVPYVLQSFTFSVSAAPNPVTVGDYEIVVVTPVDGTITLTVTAAGTETPAEFAALIAVAAAADPNLGQLANWSAAALVVTMVLKSANISIATPTTSVPGATTLTPAVLTAQGAPLLPMGRFYVYGVPQAILAITGTPRGRRIAALPTAATTLATLRGVLGRPHNQTELAGDFNDGSAANVDAYRAGQMAFGVQRGEVCVVVDPASPTMTDALDQQVHVVIAAGTYSLIGSVAGAADGGNTIRIDNAPTGNLLGRVEMVEETYRLGNVSSRCVLLKVNRTN